MNYAYEIFRLFYPERCAACGRSLPEGARLLCPRCRWDMPLTGYSAEHDNPVARKFWGLVPVQEACSMIFFTQGNAYRSMIHGFKYRGQWRTALRLGRWFGTELRESGLYGDVDVVVPVPLHYRRLLSRGYNQAEYFGRGIAEALGVPLDARSVVRSGYNRSQARTADRSERWDNVKGIFSVRRPASLAGRHLLLVDDVLTTGATLAACAEAIVGTAPACRVSMATLANFAIRPETIVATIGQQNSIVDSGEKQAGKLQIQILEDGTYKTLDDLSDQLLISSSGKQYRLGDIARVERGYAEPPQTMMRVDGRRAVGIGVSTEEGVDVVKTGAEIESLLASLTRQMPLGMELTVLYPENRIAREANSTFILNLAESVAIVILIIMLVMGFRAGVLIGSSLLFSIGGTLLLMQFLGEGLNRTSLAGFIIAMGMLVDNAIVVTDNAQQAMLRGAARRTAVVEGANAPRWSLLGATLIAIFSFLPLYLAPSSVAEIVKPLFVVLALSLLLSWVLALTQTPLFGNFMLKVKPVAGDPYDTRFYRAFDRLLAALLRWRWAVAATVAGLFVLSLAVMGLMSQNFFPSLDKPYFRADVLLPDGYNIRDTERNLLAMEEWLRAQPEVKTVSMTLGSTPPRYYLASSSISLRPNFGNILVELHDKRQTEVVEERFNAYVTANFPDVWLRSSLFKLSPVPDAAIEFGFIGDDVDTLRRLAARAEEVMWRTPGAVNIRNGWGNRVPMWQPVYSQMKGQRIGITRSQMARGITIATQGYTLGEYREGDQFMPILLKDENIGSYNLTNLQALPIFNPSGKVFSIEQATDGFRFDFRPGVIKRFNRQRVMKAQCDPGRGVNTMQLFAALRDSVDRAVVLPEGYSMKVFGEQESQQESNEALAEYMPLTLVLILIVLLLLLRNYREPVVILLMIPLIFIGVVLGLAVTGKVFNFFSLLGLLGLVGMNIKNAVVLVEQIGVLRAAGKDPYEALTSATRSRIVPVAMASGTTILGMLPLLFDSMFGAMAATIMGGLLVATLLTVCVLPVVYALFYNIRKP